MNLDNTLDALTNPEPMTQEEFEKKLLTDKDFFSDYAWKFMGSAEGYSAGLLGWAWLQYQAENTPAHKRAWKKVKSEAGRPQEYNFLKSWKAELYGEGEGR